MWNLALLVVPSSEMMFQTSRWNGTCCQVEGRLQFWDIKPSGCNRKYYIIIYVIYIL